MYSEDAVVVQPGGSSYAGNEEIRAWIVTLVENTPDGETRDLQTQSLFDASDGTVVEDGWWKHVSQDGQDQQQGSYVAIRREHDGCWQIHRDVILAN